MHIALVFVLTVYLVSVAGIGSDLLQLNLCISPVPFSFGVWCHFYPSRVMPSDPDTVCKMVLRYRTDVFPSVSPIILVMDMRLSWIVLLFCRVGNP